MLILDDSLRYNMLIESLYTSCFTTLYIEYIANIRHAYNRTTPAYNLLTLALYQN